MKTKKLTLDQILNSIFRCPLNLFHYHVEVQSSIESRNDYLFHIMYGDVYVFSFIYSDVAFYSIEEFDDYVYLKIREYEDCKDLPY